MRRGLAPDFAAGGAQEGGRNAGAAEESQDAEDDPALRGDDERRGGNQRAGQEHRQTAAERMAGKRCAEAGQQNEGPADALLPQESGEGLIPQGKAFSRAVQIYKIPAGMVQDHADQRQSPDRVKKLQTGSGLDGRDRRTGDGVIHGYHTFLLMQEISCSSKAFRLA